MNEYWDKEKIMAVVMAEMDWPAQDQPLLDWYIRKLGLNPFLAVWQDQSALNESCPPRSKYRTFRARLSRALPSKVSNVNI